MRAPRSGLPVGWRCARTALAHGVALDAVLCLGLLTAGLLSPGRSWEIWALVVGAGLAKSVLGAVFAWVGCVARARERARRTEHHQ